jgi:predicted chitinase
MIPEPSHWTAAEQLQADLSRLGFKPGRIDGKIGQRTTAALAVLGLEGLTPEKAARQLRRQVNKAAGELYFPSLEEMRRFSPDFPAEWLKPLHDSITLAHITRARLPYFLAQLGHESDTFATLEEYASGADYEGRKDLGNTRKGDGKKYKGRGPIQITGRANYRTYGKLLGEPLEKSPKLAATPEIGFALAALYWLGTNLNSISDTGDFKALTRAINGGLNGLEHRQTLYQLADALFRRGAGRRRRYRPRRRLS